MNSIVSTTTRRQPPGTPESGIQAASDYLVYRPDNLCRDLPPIVFVHGYSRRAQEQVAVLRRLADASRRALIAPLFTVERHPRYQRLGKGRDGQRADHYFDACLARAGEQLGVCTDRFSLLGYSGGAQFGHRWTMTRPGRVEHLLAVAAGWYTFPDPELAFPIGLATAGRLRRVILDPAEFLAVPTTVLVGADDRDAINLRRGARIDAQQGVNRVERARRWVLAMRMAARLYRVDARIDYREVPGVDHDFDGFVAKGNLIELLLAAMQEVAQRGDATSGVEQDRVA